MSSITSTHALREALAGELAQFPELFWRLQGLKASAPAYVLARLLQPAASGKSEARPELERAALIVTASDKAAEELAAELQAFFGEASDDSFLARRVHLFPSREAPPLEMLSPSSDVEAARTAALYALSQSGAPIVVACVDALAQWTMAPQALRAASLYFVVGDEILLEDLVGQLQAAGYRNLATVDEPGELAVRGGIIDVWPPGFEYPLRVEVDFDRIASIRLFDPADQRSFQPSEELVVLPSLPVPLERMAESDVRRAIADRCEELLLPSTERRRLDDYLASEAHFPGVELLAPYAMGARFTIADFLPAGALMVAVDPPAIEEAIEAMQRSLDEAAEAARAAGSFFPDPQKLYLERAQIRALVSRRPHLELDYAEVVESIGEPGHRAWRVEVRTNTQIAAARARVKARRGESGFAPVVETLTAARAEGLRVIMMASGQTQLGRIEHLLSLAGVDKVLRADTFAIAQTRDARHIWLVEGHLREGFTLTADHLLVVSDEELFGERRSRPRRRRASRSRMLSALAELKPQDFVVHVDHGVARYHGLKHLKAAGMEGDFLHLEYAGGDRLYLPVDRINLVEKFTGASGSEPALDKIGGAAWERAKRKARDSILEMARELLDLEAYRQVHTRPGWAEPGADFEEFEARFPFEETEGQLTAIKDIIADLERARPMDRVVCGDVGYGKTEVAIRAAYLAAMAGRQVGFLVPTTVLARQHYETLRSRFDGYPIHIAMLSRFHSKQENQAIVRGLADGTIDIVVGTHRLLQRDIRFARLGLLVIDEEHRFGVKAKEHIKAMRREVDVLTLTATPIPRTLQLALSGVRDLSVIETPPVDRLAIRTYVARHDEGLIQQAIQRELGRGGQVFFVHNRVSSIEQVARRLGELVPGARVAIAHGQMDEGDLEKVMVEFLEHESDVLVCTSIIESGLDISNANTILVNRADAFGLAQLYQIRGRVGRSHRRAYAYLLVPSERITDDARKRLAVLQDLDDLGAGFRLAAHDLEIRGAGNLLGKEQSGHIGAIGFDMFLRMMEEATAEVRGLPPVAHFEPEIELGAGAFLPDWYVSDIGERLILYKRLAAAEDSDAVMALREELQDRFGVLPQEAQRFVRIMSLRPALRRLRVVSLKASDNVVALRFDEASSVSRELLLELAHAQPRRYRIRPEGVLMMTAAAQDWDGLVEEVEHLLDRLEAGSKGGALDDGKREPTRAQTFRRARR
ncbi:MAG TPA: transcription-repair coupling factor [Candidatus Binatia bacterium]|nr:transcription-repair coupling factor [Candidatus Binatia bacterium]